MSNMKYMKISKRTVGHEVRTVKQTIFAFISGHK